MTKSRHDDQSSLKSKRQPTETVLRARERITNYKREQDLEARRKKVDAKNKSWRVLLTKKVGAVPIPMDKSVQPGLLSRTLARVAGFFFRAPRTNPLSINETTGAHIRPAVSPPRKGRSLSPTFWGSNEQRTYQQAEFSPMNAGFRRWR